MSERVALLLQAPDGNTVAVICASREASDRIREASPMECVGVAAIVSRVDAVITNREDGSKSDD